MSEDSTIGTAELIDEVKPDADEAASHTDQNNTYWDEETVQASDHAPPRMKKESSDGAAIKSEPSSTERDVEERSAEDRAEETSESDETGMDRGDSGLIPRWRQHSSPATEFAGLEDAEAIALARLVYAGAGFTAMFGIRANGIVEMKSDEVELAQEEVKVRQPLRISHATFKFLIPPGTPTIHIGQFNRLLRGVLPPKDAELPAGVTIQDDTLIISDLEIVPDDPNINVAPDWRRSKRRFAKVEARNCFGREILIDVSNTRVRHDLELVNVVAHGLNGSSTRFDGKLNLYSCSFIGVEVGRSEHKADDCSLNLRDATLAGRLTIFRSVIGPAHKRSGQHIQLKLPESAFEKERPKPQLIMDGIRSDADIYIQFSCLFGTARFVQAQIGSLWLLNCSVIGDLTLSWMNARVITIEHRLEPPYSNSNVELRSIGCTWARLGSERVGIRGSVEIGGSEIEKNITFKGILICDSIAVWQTTALNFDFRGAMVDSPSTAGLTSVLPARVYGALWITETIARTSITVRGTHVLRFGYKQIGKATDEFSGGPVDKEFLTKEWPSRRKESRQGHQHEQGWKLADDGKVAVRDSRVGFDLAIAGVAARSAARLADRLNKRLHTACEGGVDLEGLTIGGDLDLRGLVTPRDVCAENVRVQGHVRVGLESLLRELRERGTENQTEIDATRPTNEGVAREGEPTASDPTVTTAGQQSPSHWWMEPEEAAQILLNSRTTCRRFRFRSSRVEGDLRLDGLNASASDDNTSSNSDVKGSVTIQACVIRGDLSFALKNGPASDELFVTPVWESADEIDSRPGSDSTRRRMYIINTMPEYHVLGYAHIQGGLDLTQSSCGHLLISGICFEASEADYRELPPANFHAFSTDRFELIDSPIARRCNLDALKVAWWDIREDRFGRSNAAAKRQADEESVNIDFLTDFLTRDPQVPRSTYTSVERSLLEQGEVVKAEKVRKQMWAESAAKPAELTIEKGPRRWMQMFSNWTGRQFQRGASKFGYGGNITLFSPLLLFVCVSVGLCVYVATGLQGDAFEASLLRSIEQGEATFVEPPVPGYFDAVLVAARATLPGLGLLIAEDYRASTEPLPGYGGVSMNHLLDLVSIVGWVFWLLTAVVISLRVFRSAGLRASD